MEDFIKDDIVGELKYLSSKNWGRRLDCPVLNSDGNLILKVQDPNKEGILDIQREAYKTYLQNEERYKSSVIDFVLAYYKWNYEYIAREVDGVDENDHKDVVTEKELYQFITLCYLFICRDGSFGYAFECCWDEDNGLAVLLSESEPRVISRIQLENLHKFNDPVLGLLVHDGKNTWKGLEVNSFFGKKENLEIELDGGVDEKITVAQQKAYALYLEEKEALFDKLIKPYDGKILPKTLKIDRAGNYRWHCYTEWNDDYLQVSLQNGEIDSFILGDELFPFEDVDGNVMNIHYKIKNKSVEFTYDEECERYRMSVEINTFSDDSFKETESISIWHEDGFIIPVDDPKALKGKQFVWEEDEENENGDNAGYMFAVETEPIMDAVIDIIDVTDEDIVLRWSGNALISWGPYDNEYVPFDATIKCAYKFPGNN